MLYHLDRVETHLYYDTESLDEARLVAEVAELDNELEM